MTAPIEYKDGMVSNFNFFPFCALIIPKKLFRHLYRKNRKALKVYLALSGYNAKENVLVIALSDHRSVEGAQIMCTKRDPMPDEKPKLIVRRAVRRFIAKK